jgi:hypothetical protein
MFTEPHRAPRSPEPAGIVLIVECGPQAGPKIAGPKTADGFKCCGAQA